VDGSYIGPNITLLSTVDDFISLALFKVSTSLIDMSMNLVLPPTQILKFINYNSLQKSTRQEQKT
jgi:hypothetical protein